MERGKWTEHGAVCSGLNGNDHSVVTELETFWKLRIYLIVESDVVAHVGEIDSLCVDFLREVYRLINHQMRVVLRLEAQGVDHKSVNALKERQFAVVDSLHVGDVGEIADAESADRQRAVIDRKYLNINISDGDNVVVIVCAGSDGWYARVFVFRKEIGQGAVHGIDNPFVAVDWNVAEDTERTEVVYAAAVVVVDVGNEDGINFAADGFRCNLGKVLGVVEIALDVELTLETDVTEMAQHLLAEVGTAVDEYASGVAFHHGSRTETTVFRVAAGAYGTGTTDNRNTARCSCSEKSYFEICVLHIHVPIPLTYIMSTCCPDGGSRVGIPVSLPAVA